MIRTKSAIHIDARRHERSSTVANIVFDPNNWPENNDNIRMMKACHVITLKCELLRTRRLAVAFQKFKSYQTAKNSEFMISKLQEDRQMHAAKMESLQMQLSDCFEEISKSSVENHVQLQSARNELSKLDDLRAEVVELQDSLVRKQQEYESERLNLNSMIEGLRNGTEELEQDKVKLKTKIRRLRETQKETVIQAPSFGKPTMSWEIKVKSEEDKVPTLRSPNRSRFRSSSTMRMSSSSQLNSSISSNTFSKIASKNENFSSTTRSLHRRSVTPTPQRTSLFNERSASNISLPSIALIKKQYASVKHVFQRYDLEFSRMRYRAMQKAMSNTFPANNPGAPKDSTVWLSFCSLFGLCPQLLNRRILTRIYEHIATIYKSTRRKEVLAIEKLNLLMVVASNVMYSGHVACKKPEERLILMLYSMDSDKKQFPFITDKAKPLLARIAPTRGDFINPKKIVVDQVNPVAYDVAINSSASPIPKSNKHPSTSITANIPKQSTISSSNPSSLPSESHVVTCKTPRFKKQNSLVVKTTPATATDNLSAVEKTPISSSSERNMAVVEEQSVLERIRLLQQQFKSKW
eukprot:TRINITY_DN8671_c0_g1_i1.p1 TRINITY_DN8671_c0_g1~~TRINITY_DN8671_c0_g1_i1.p1  ORF type:complete len:579 (-),score=133.34 TRINITY_DN8671_c0_g1_i1:171-1907(-)